MKTKLAIRNIEARLAVAFMSHAVHDFINCDPGDTLERWFTTPEITMEHDGTRVHPYSYMWLTTGEFYDELFARMSDNEIRDRYKAALRVGFEYKGEHIPASRVIQAATDFETRKWKRYEYKRNARRANAWKVAPWGVSLTVALCTGIFINPNGGAA